MRSTIVAVLAAVACGTTTLACARGDRPGGGAAPTTAAPPPSPTPVTGAPSDAELDALMHELVELLGAAATAVEAAGPDCAAMASQLERLAGEHATFYERARRADDPSVEDRSQRWLAAHDDVIAPLVARLTAGVARCDTDPAVQRAVERIGGT